MKRTQRRSAVASLAMAALFAVSGPASAQNYPLTTGSLNVGSNSVAAGAATTVSGSGCEPGAAVSISYGGSNIGSTSASASGDFSTSVTLPASASGAGTLESSCDTTDGGSLVLSASITATAANQTTTTTTTATSAGNEELAFSGVETWVYATVGSSLALAGGLMLVMSRRTRNI